MSGRAPRLSLVLPYRDAATTLADSIRTLRHQSFTSFECILVDNESADGSPVVARSACGEDARFRHLHVPGSLVDALNSGIAVAQTPLIARMDADDLAHPRRLELQVHALDADPGLSVVSSLIGHFPAAAATDGMRRYERWINGVCSPTQIRDALFVESPLPHPSVLMTRTAVLDAGGYQETGGPEDYDLWMRLLLAGHRARKVPEVLLHWRDSPGRLSRVDPRYHADRFFETKLRYLPQVLERERPLQICGAGPTGRRWARALTRQGYQLRCFLDVDPRKIGRRVRGAPVRPLEKLDPSAGFVLSAVGSPGAREQITSFLAGRGLRAWQDYLCVA